MTMKLPQNLAIAGLIAGISAGSASAATVAYWNTASGGTNIVDLAGGDHNLTGGSGLGASAIDVAPNPVPNPDGVTSGATGSILTGTSSLAASTSNASAFKLTTSDSFTFEGWLLHNVTDGTHAAYEYIGGDRMRTTSPSYSGWHIVVTSGALQFFAQGTTIDTTTAIDDGEAHHFAVTWDHTTSTASVYVDGALEGSASVTPVSYTQDSFQIGGRATGTDGILNDNIFDGRLDELRFSNEVLSSSQFLNAPEPGSLALMGLGGLLVVRRRRG